MTAPILSMVSVAALFWGQEKEAAAEITERSGALVKSIVLPSRSFDERTLRQLARKEIHRLGPRGSCVMRFIPQDSGPPLPKPSHLTFAAWRRLYEEIATGVSVQYAELLKIAGDSVLRIRRGEAIKNIVLDGHDPRFKRLGGLDYEILYIAAHTPRTMQGLRADIYVRSDAEPQVDGALRLLAEFVALFPGREVHVYIRRDRFFVEEPSYPFVNPLLAPVPPPTQEEYSQGKTLRCFIREREPFCSSD